MGWHSAGPRNLSSTRWGAGRGQTMRNRSATTFQGEGGRVSLHEGSRRGKVLEGAATARLKPAAKIPGGSPKGQIARGRLLAH
jgi:hypothetical protein